jgi:integrase
LGQPDPAARRELEERCGECLEEGRRPLLDGAHAGHHPAPLPATGFDRAGVRAHDVVHDLRHTAASELLIRGTPLPEGARILGHAGPHVVAVYAHLVPRGGRAALEDAEASSAQLEREALRDEETAIRTASGSVAPPRHQP